MTVAVTSRQTVKRSAISARHSGAVSRCRPGRKCGEMPLNADKNRCACPGRCEPLHRSFPLPGGLMRVLDPIVEVLRAAMLDRCQQLAVGDLVAAEFVGDDHPRHV